MKLSMLTRYFPEDPALGVNVAYLIDEDGLDWYDSQDKFEKKYKLAINADGLIQSVSEYISSLFPVNLSVVETDELPDDFSEKSMLQGEWKWDGETVIPVSDELLLQATRKTVSQLSLEAFALQCAADAGTASSEQLETLAALKNTIAESIGENKEAI